MDVIIMLVKNDVLKSISSTIKIMI